jgi:hypothetical protein
LGTIAKPKFTSSLSNSFHKLGLEAGAILALADHYGTGPADVRNGGQLDVRWKDFTNAVLSGTTS